MTFPVTGAGDSVPGDTKGLGQSELEYPLDALLVGARYRQVFREADGGGIGLRLAAWTNATQPDGKMRDTDWTGSRSSPGTSTTSVLFKSGYTQSRARLRWNGGEAGADIGAYALFGKPVIYGLAVRVERLDYRLYGASGWQREPNQPAREVSVPDEELVLAYGLTRVRPRLFAEMRLARRHDVDIKAALSLAPALAWDHDDHVLRHKESDTFAYGFEVGGGAEMDIRIAAHFMLTAGADLAYLRTRGEMDQRFYGDDPATGGNEAGTTIDNVVTRIIGLGGGATLGLRFLF
jgi:hypothetical protein